MRQQQTRQTHDQQANSNTSEESGGRHQGQTSNVQNLHGGPFQ
jgi:hypothetical protein